MPIKLEIEWKAFGHTLIKRRLAQWKNRGIGLDSLGLNSNSPLRSWRITGNSHPFPEPQGPYLWTTVIIQPFHNVIWCLNKSHGYHAKDKLGIWWTIVLLCREAPITWCWAWLWRHIAWLHTPQYGIFQVVQSRASYRLLRLHFFICQMGIAVLLTSKSCCQDWVSQ